MSDIYTLPPAPHGTAEQQLMALNDYLVRLSRQLNKAGTEAASGNVMVTDSNRTATIKTQAAEKKKTEDLPSREQVTRLQDLILKTASTVDADIEIIRKTMKSDYVAQSDFGTYKQQVSTEFTETAEAVTTVSEKVTEVDAKAAYGISLVEEIRASIVQGFLTYNEVEYYGIAIGQNVKTTETTITREGKVYNQLSTEAQSVGIYTSSGWHFFINGILVGSFDSVKGMLAVPQITVDTDIFMGRWQVSSAGTWGVRFIGGNNG